MKENSSTKAAIEYPAMLPLAVAPSLSITRLATDNDVV